MFIKRIRANWFNPDIYLFESFEHKRFEHVSIKRIDWRRTPNNDMQSKSVVQYNSKFCKVLDLFLGFWVLCHVLQSI